MHRAYVLVAYVLVAYVRRVEKEMIPPQGDHTSQYPMHIGTKLAHLFFENMSEGKKRRNKFQFPIFFLLSEIGNYRRSRKPTNKKKALYGLEDL
jgi:hypothetical protein